MGLHYPVSLSILYECPSLKSMRQLRNACFFTNLYPLFRRS